VSLSAIHPDRDQAFLTLAFARCPTQRDIRLASGLVLFVYVTSHLVNHALLLIKESIVQAYIMSKAHGVTLSTTNTLPTLRNMKPVRQLDRRLAGQQDHERGERRAEYLGIDDGTHSLLQPDAEQQRGYRQNGQWQRSG
jgi:hypothetical protein